jgi:hypothetical protein|tara:strand:+ start:414 stop:629 length:216 start_codon:yes stop_codon:yes gene_type:complete
LALDGQEPHAAPERFVTPVLDALVEYRDYATNLQVLLSFLTSGIGHAHDLAYPSLNIFQAKVIAFQDLIDG